ncbi:hypothetical protein TIFTF001_043316 [Ficus carica]|uniref:Uncharacterized protein n=1 Tax=Ficus carica TaxID=3494 RepID=A0AA87YRB8_FICCA|nr:hypothetical protein TIFTF001_043316 [Ficus carica]
MVESRMVSRSARGLGIDSELKWELDFGKGIRGLIGLGVIVGYQNRDRGQGLGLGLKLELE